VVLLRPPFGLRLRFGKIGTSAFISSNSEHISCTTFMKYETTENRELELWHLVNRLVCKMYKIATKCKQNI
jgi:hypothetical protein